VLRAYLKQMTHKLTVSIETAVTSVDHKSVIKDLVSRADITGSYLLMLVLSCLVALLGLLTNSVAVVIGAMLISPLMGPIFTAALAFGIGDLHLARKTLKIIVVSILLSVLVAAFFTLLSPLKAPTQEILSRTRPNIYDLLIAFFAGIAGALAICTRKNYLFTTTGVAVATAVIPPLSVVGYGFGTWQPGIAAGGFLLFFTNLVAILISADVVFYLFRFRGSMAAETNNSVRRRFQILGSVLAIISIPLIITLVTDIRKVKLTGRVNDILKAHLNVKQNSRLTRVSIGKDDGNFMVTASINTVKYMDSATLKSIENELASRLEKPVKLELEQVIVRSGAVDPPTLLHTAVPLVAPPPPETLAVLGEKAMARLREGCREIDSYITPYRISDCSLKFSDRGGPVSALITIARDYPLGVQEQRWLRTALEKKLAETIELKTETIPLLPPIKFTDKDEVDESSRKSLEQLRQIIAMLPAYRLTIEAPRTGRRTDPGKARQVNRLKEYLTKEIKVPDEHIFIHKGNETVTRVTIKN